MFFEVVRVHEDGVMAIVLERYTNGVYAVWLVDGLRMQGFLEPDEYTPITDFKEGIDD